MIDEYSALKIAAILDEFSYASFSLDCNILNLSLHNWKLESEKFCPDLLFVESAWFGHQKEWYRKISEFSPQLDELITWFKNQKIPTKME